MPVNVRRAAHTLLDKTVNHGGYSNHLLEAFYAQNPDVPENDRALLKTIFFGVLRNLIYLDSLLAAQVSKPLGKLPPPILMALRVGLYQIAFLERIPAHAAVNESVKLARRYGHKGTAGLVNAVLRRFAGMERAGLTPDTASDDMTELAVATSHPLWLAGKYRHAYGPEKAAAIMRHNNQQPPLNLRGDKETLTRAGLTVEENRFTPFGFTVTGGNTAALPGLIREGKVAPQDQSSLIAASLGKGMEGDTLELCSGRGNKTAALAASVQGRVVSCDLSHTKLKMLKAARVPGNSQVCCDALSPLPFRRRFRFIFIDAPCSNMGTVRRHPELKYRRDELDAEAFARTQAGILRRAAPLVDGGGALLYAVCSFEPEETDAVADGFLRENPEFSPVDIGARRPDLHEAGLVDRGCVRIFPGDAGMDGFFAALFKKQG